MLRYVGAFVLGIALLTPAAVDARYQDRDRDHQEHVWSDNENSAWHQYLKERHKKEHEWAKASKKEQKDYWKWRDAHRDVDRH
jgi:hypothetical protein